MSDTPTIDKIMLCKIKAEEKGMNPNTIVISHLDADSATKELKLCGALRAGDDLFGMKVLISALIRASGPVCLVDANQ